MTSFSRDDFRKILMEAVMTAEGAQYLDTLLPQSCGACMHFFCDKNENIALRQLAGISVKNCIQKISAQFQKDQEVLQAFQQLGMPSEEIIKVCFELLTENNAKISSTASFLLVQFANLSNVLEKVAVMLIEKVFPSQPYQALKCLCYLVEEYISSVDTKLFSNFLAFSMKILESKMHIQARAKGFYLLNLLLRNYRNNGNKTITPANASKILGYIAEAVVVRPEFNALDAILSLEAWKLMLTLLEFKKDASRFTDLIFKMITHSLKSLYAIYERKDVKVSPDDADLDGESCYDSEGGLVSNAIITSQILECIQVMLSHAEYEMEEYLGAVTELSMKLSQRSTNEEVLLLSDPNRFYAEDEDSRFSNSPGTFSNSASASCFSCLTCLIENFESDALEGIFNAAEKLLKESETMLKQQISYWWKPREAVLSVFSSIAEDVKDTEEDEMINLVKKIMVQLPQNDLNPQSPPMLKFSALAFLNANAYLLKDQPDLAESFFNATVPLLSENNSLAVRLSAALTSSSLIALNGALPDAMVNQIVPSLASSYYAILVSSTEDTVHVPLQSMAVILKKPQTLAALTQHDNICSIFLNTYFNFANDPLVSMECMQVIKALIAHRHYYTKCVQEAIPKILSVWHSPTYTFLTGTVIDLFEHLVRPATIEDAEKLLDVAFIPLLSIMLKNDDDTLLQNGDQCIRTFIHVAPQLIMNHKLPNGSTPLSMIMEVIAKQLDLEMPAGASAYVGGLIVSLLEKCGSSISEDVFKQMLQASLLRLTSVSDLSLIQSLLFLISKLLHSHFNPINELLTRMRVEDVTHPEHVNDVQKASTWTSAFHVVLSIWMDNNAFVFGKYERNVIGTALGLLLLKSDMNILNNITLTITAENLGKDFKSAPEQKRPRTRSQAKSNEHKISGSMRIFIALCEMFSQEYDTRLEETKRKKLELTSLKFLLPSDNKPKKRQFDFDDDDDEYLYLSSLAAMDDEDDMDNIDPFAEEDPLNKIELYEVLPDILRQATNRYGIEFVQNASQYLNKQQGQLLQLILK